MNRRESEIKLSVKINGHRTVTKRDEKFTVYRIVSGERGKKNASSVCEIERRYTDFCILHQELQKRKPDGVCLPEMPPKRFNNMSKSVIAKRSTELQKYLNEVTNLPNEYGKDTIEAFLGVSFSTSLDSDTMNPYGWANRTQQSGTLRTQYRRSSSHSGGFSCGIL